MIKVVKLKNVARWASLVLKKDFAGFAYSTNGPLDSKEKLLLRLNSHMLVLSPNLSPAAI